MSKSDNTIRVKSIPGEEWMPVVGCNHLYEVSNLGRVRSFDKPKRIGFGRVMNWRGRLFKAKPDRNGYPVVNLRLKSHQLVHRLVATAFIPNPEGKPYVNHKNGIRGDARAVNLEWVTASENALHAFRVLRRKPVSQPGESHNMAKLTDEKVRHIRIMGQYLYHDQIAETFGMSRGQISRIIRGDAWCHVK